MASGTRTLLIGVLATIAGASPLSAAGEAPAAVLSADELAFLKEETVVAATGFAQPTFESSANVFVVTRKDIERMNPQNLGDIFRLVPGLATYSVGTDFNLAAGGVGARFSNLLLVQLDGAPVIEALYAQTPWNLLPVAPGDIERIEVMVGPATSLYGENAFTGVVDIITRKPAREVTAGGSATLAAGTHDFGRLALRGAAPGERSVLEARAGYETSDGPRFRSIKGFPNPDLPSGSTEREPLWADVSWRLDLDKYRQLGLEVSHTRQDLGSLSEFSGLPTQGETEMTMLVGRYRQQINPDQEFRLRLQHNSQDWTAFTVNGTLAGELDVPTKQRLFDFDASKSVDARKLRSIMGVSWRRRQAEGNAMVPGEHDYGTRSVYYQAEYEFDRRWAVFGSTRYVDADITGGDAAFKLDLRRRVSAREVVRVGTGRAFRTPDLATLYLAPVTELNGVPLGGVILDGNPNLENEQTESVQLGYERRSTRTTFKLDLFRQRSWDLITPLWNGNPVPTLFGYEHQMGNLADELTSVGVTCHWENRLSERFTLVVNGTLQDADFSSGTRHEGYAPRELYNLDLRFFPVRGQTFDLLLTHQSSVWPLQYGYDPFLATEVPGYNRVDLTWRRELARGALAVTVRNLFDDEVLGVTRGVPQYAPELGREFFVSYTVKF